MKPRAILSKRRAPLASLLLAAATLALGPGWADTNEPPIDVARGRALMQKWQRGESLTPVENAYLDRVRREIQRRSVQQPAVRRSGSGGAARVPADWTRLVPIPDLKTNYHGEDGGLYGGGRNDPPEAHRAAYLKASAQVRPLDATGQPARDGRIVLLTLGFSNTSIESEDFVRVGSADAQKSPAVVLVNGAIGGRAAVMWAYDGSDSLPPAEQARLDREMDVLRMPKTGRRTRVVPEDRDTWPTVERRLRQAGVTPAQVQAVWMKHVEAGAAALGEFPTHARALQADLADILIIARKRFPNLRVALLSSRTYGGWAAPNAGSPEPYAYESGFAVRWVLQDQIRGNPRLNYDATRGEVRAPVAIWGPYLWACGDRQSAADGLTWTEQDVRSNDHMHPSDAGSRKVTNLLLQFLKTDTGARRWFSKPAGPN